MLQHATHDLIDSLFKQAEASERRRAFHNFHAKDDMLNRLLIAGTTGSYAAPHRHANKLEAFSPVEGGVIVAEFADDGKLVSAFDLRRAPYVEVRPMTWHTLIYITDRWSVMELGLWKEKYDPTDKEFAPWAPKEGTPAAAEYARQLAEAAAALLG